MLCAQFSWISLPALSGEQQGFQERRKPKRYLISRQKLPVLCLVSRVLFKNGLLSPYCNSGTFPLAAAHQGRDGSAPWGGAAQPVGWSSEMTPGTGSCWQGSLERKLWISSFLFHLSTETCQGWDKIPHNSKTFILCETGRR